MIFCCKFHVVHKLHLKCLCCVYSVATPEKMLWPSHNALLPMGILYRWSCGSLVTKLTYNERLGCLLITNKVSFITKDRHDQMWQKRSNGLWEGHNALWEGHNIFSVATPKSQPQVVWCKVKGTLYCLRLVIQHKLYTTQNKVICNIL